jgi:uncharacterized protein (TIGR01777 family)
VQINSRPIVIAGGSGFLGTSLASSLVDSGARVVVLTRRVAESARWESATWDGRTTGDWVELLDGAVGLVNLTGRTVDCIKTPDHQDEILRSRVESTRVLGEALRLVNNPPPVWVQMSTAHIYGDPSEVRCTETSSLGYGLAPIVGRAWEEAFFQSALPEQRHVVLRTGFVLGRDRGAGQGALGRLRTVTRLGLGGRIGSGRQGMSWIHESDVNRLFQRALTDTSMRGVYNVASPHPVSQQEFMRELRRVMGMPIGLPAPELMIRLGAKWVLRTDPELALYGRFVLPQRLLDEGYEFRFPQLAPALRDLLAPEARSN